MQNELFDRERRVPGCHRTDEEPEDGECYLCGDYEEDFNWYEPDDPEFNEKFCSICYALYANPVRKVRKKVMREQINEN